MRWLLYVVVLAVAAGMLSLQGCGGGGGNDGGQDGGDCSDPNGVATWNGGPPATLTATGLYQGNVADPQQLASGVRLFRPAHELWSDGAQKSRWVKLPPCATVDTSDMDHWSMPVGTRFWKEFMVNGQRVETRLIARTGPASSTDPGFIFAAYQWNAGQTDATLVTGGVQNANGTQHDIPSLSQCGLCHGSLPEHILGFSAIQLTHPATGSRDEVTLDTLAAEGRLSAAPADGGYPVPGNSVEAAALGYLHANCGNCHHPAGIVFDYVPFNLRLEVGQRTVDQTSTYVSAVRVPVERYYRPGITHRIAPGNPDASCVSARISVRAPGEQMPPLATETVDTNGVAAVNAWIRSMPP